TRALCGAREGPVRATCTPARRRPARCVAPPLARGRPLPRRPVRRSEEDAPGSDQGPRQGRLRGQLAVPGDDLAASATPRRGPDVLRQVRELAEDRPVRRLGREDPLAAAAPGGEGADLEDAARAGGPLSRLRRLDVPPETQNPARPIAASVHLRQTWVRRCRN